MTNICARENVRLKPNRRVSLEAKPLHREWYCRWTLLRCCSSSLTDKNTKSPLGRAGISSSLCVSPSSPQSQGPVLSQALLPLPLRSLWVQIKAQRVPAQLSAEESDGEKEREKAGQEMPSRSQDSEWFMCAGMLREEDLGFWGVQGAKLENWFTVKVNYKVSGDMARGVPFLFSFFFLGNRFLSIPQWHTYLNVQVWCYFNKKGKNEDMTKAFFPFMEPGVVCIFFPKKCRLQTCRVSLSVIKRVVEL